MIDMAVNFGADELIAKIDMKECLKLENQLINPKVFSKSFLFVICTSGSHPEPFFQIPFELIKSTPKRVQANYLYLLILEYSLKPVSENLRNLVKDRNKNQTASSKFWCTLIVKENFKHLLLSMYIEQFSKTFYRKDILKSGIVDNIKNQYLESLRKV